MDPIKEGGLQEILIDTHLMAISMHLPNQLVYVPLRVRMDVSLILSAQSVVALRHHQEAGRLALAARPRTKETQATGKNGRLSLQKPNAQPIGR